MDVPRTPATTLLFRLLAALDATPGKKKKKNERNEKKTRVCSKSPRVLPVSSGKASILPLFASAAAYCFLFSLSPSLSFYLFFFFLCASACFLRMQSRILFGAHDDDTSVIGNGD